MRGQAAEMAPEITELADDDLELLLLIRNFELALLDLFAAGRLNGTTHTCLGQEYVPVALAPLLRDDFVFSNHRGHGHYLARFRDPAGLLAEIMGRSGALCAGVGGSQHIYRDGFLSTGVQGQSLPVAVGVALHYRRTGEERIAVAHIGDGTWGEGSVYEALNMARLWEVPLLVVVEDNGIAQSTPTERQLAGTVSGRARAFGAAYHSIHSTDVNAIRAELAPLVADVRQRGVPAVVHFHCLRLGPHSKGDDTRSEAELADVRAREWSARYAQHYGDRFAAADARTKALMADLVAEVSARPPSRWPGLADAYPGAAA
ncbi:thiamine pyrophosphate-dependent dehydrogenase E1 component subunit alpha [Streptomyces sp. NPDC006624]|uniref:thiamine pyrophosphate-dependent dehydrogenase E1 component subunit alpha n=1 Tax=unclassified Streptomyces TaxID=2593676 RepID=UPI0033BFA867